MKPSGVLLFIIAVFLLLIAIALYFPKEGMHLTGTLKLNFFSPMDIITGNGEYADIGELLHRQEQLNDSLIADYTENRIMSDTVKANVDSLLASITRIEYPPDDTTVLFPFFSALKNLNHSHDLIRILHYGDSQIEDDRITSYLRFKLQGRFGGSGIGLVPASPVYNLSFSMTQANSDNWNRYIVCGNTDTSLIQNRYGAMAGFGTYVPVDNPPGNPDAAVEAWVEYGPSPYSYKNTKNFTQCRIFYGFNPRPFITELYLKDSLIDAEMLPVSDKLKILRWNFDTPQQEIMLKFTGAASPEIYGIALDGASGIAVDNIPLRGCSGPFLTQIDEQLLADMYKALKVKLFILQFGGNMVPAVIKNFSGYESWFVSQIKRIRETCPDAAVLVVGLADMSVKEKNRYVTSQNVEKVRDALKNAAFKSHAAFWDMYKAMGGRNSMPSWVYAEPSLAAGDFVHFNLNGSKIIAQMLYNAFILEYQRFDQNDNQIAQQHN